MAAMNDQTPPQGYARHFRRSTFTDPWEPLYSCQRGTDLSIGLYLGAAHCNSRGMVHGGLIAALADNAMGLSCVAALHAEGRTVSGLVTVNLATDFIGAAKLGAWLATETDFVKTGGTLAFAGAKVHADGEIIARATATFKILKPE
jgi:acyl-coenzyme A thioesterase PaaI-like protein